MLRWLLSPCQKILHIKGEKYKKLNSIPVIRQMLIYPPLVIQQPMNKRTGHFKRIEKNPIDLVELNPGEWICYPAKVGKLLIMVYFHLEFFELGFSMCNLFSWLMIRILKENLMPFLFMVYREMHLTDLQNIHSIL